MPKGLLNREYLLKAADKKIISGDVDEAIKFIDTILKDNPEDIEALNLMAIAYRIKNKPRKAEQILKKALKIDPYFPDTHYYLALLYYERGKYIRAIEEFYKAIENFLPTEKDWIADAYVGLGEAFFELGLTEDAKKAWKKALKYNPKHRRAKKYLKNLTETERETAVRSDYYIFEFIEFSNMKISEYLALKGKEKFDSERELKSVLRKIVTAWDKITPRERDRLKTMTEKERRNYFKSIKIKF